MIDDFLYGKCASFALAAHNLSDRKLKLGAILGIRQETEDDEEEYVLVHAFVFHPADQTKCIDASGVRSISEIEDQWLAGHDRDSFEQLFCDVVSFEDRISFIEDCLVHGFEFDSDDYELAKLIFSKQGVPGVVVSSFSERK